MSSEFPAIIDLNGYTEKMRKGLLDKTFFLEKIVDATVFVDFGCANGDMIEFMFKLFPEYHYYGYDTDAEMLKQANAKKVPKAKFFGDFNEMMRDISTNHKDKKKVLILSSVLHEVYHYRTGNPLTNGWAVTFDYIAIRDMFVHQTPEQPALRNEVVWKLARYYLDNKDDSYILTSFIDKYGNIDNMSKLVHFLLKYRYKNNWERELPENYLAFTPLILKNISLLNDSSWTNVYYNHFTLPWLKNQVKEDFDIDLTEPTHLKAIWRKK